MFKKFICILLGIIISGAMVFSPLLYSPAYASDEGEEAAEEETQEEIEKAKYYYVKHYKSGDCVLCANAYMLMRSAYAHDSYFFDTITNKKLRKYACTSKTGNIMKHEYTFTHDGLKFTVKQLKLKGDYSERKKKIKSMLKKHPEGIVGLGQSKYGSHGVLLVGYRDGVLYAADSARNFGSMNEGITTYKDTIMKSLKTIKYIWYIKDVSGSSISNHVKDMKLSIKATKTGSKFKLTWNKRGDDTELSGFKLTYIGQKALENGEKYKLIERTREHYKYIKDKKNGKSYYYKVRGYVKDGNGKYVYTKSAKVLVTMSDPE